jgi:hypothetical protein
VFPKRPNDPQSIHRETRGYPAGCIDCKSMAPWEKRLLSAVFAALIN